MQSEKNLQGASVHFPDLSNKAITLKSPCCTIHFSGLILSSHLRGHISPVGNFEISRQESSKFKEEDIEKLTDILVENYIASWSKNLHNGKDELCQELRDGLGLLLTRLFQKFEKVDKKDLFKNLTCLLRSHLFAKNVPKQPNIENSVRKLLENLEMQNLLSSDLVFDSVSLLITNLVVRKLTEKLSQPSLIHSLIFAKAEKDEDLQMEYEEKVEESWTEPEKEEKDQKEAFLATKLEPFVSKKTPAEVRRDNMRLSFQKHGRISSALGTNFCFFFTLNMSRIYN